MREYTPPGGAVPVSFGTALITVSALVVLGIGIVIAIATGVREDRAFDATASALGVGDGDILAVHALSSAGAALAGCVVGAVVGAGVALTELARGGADLPLVLRWEDVLTVGLGAVLAAALTAGIAVRSARRRLLEWSAQAD